MSQAIVVDFDAVSLRTAHVQKIEADMRAAGNRKAVKRALFEIAQRKQRRGELQRRIRELDSELENSVNSHQKIAAPIQQKLKAIDLKAVEELLANKPTDAMEEQRSGLLRQLEDANTALESQTKTLNARRKILDSELQSAELNISAEGGLQNELFKTGEAAKLDRHWAIRNTIEGIRVCRDGAAAKAAHYAEMLDEMHAGKYGDAENEVFRLHLRPWKAATAHAGKLLDELTAAERKLREEIVNE